MEDHDKVVSLVPLEDYPINWDYLRQLMTQKGLSYPALERLSRVPESTLRKLMQGKTKDPRVNSLLPVVRALEGSADMLFGIVPLHLPPKEQTSVDVAVMDAMRTLISASMQPYNDADAEAVAQIALLSTQVSELKQLVADQDERLGKKRGMLDDQSSEIARLNERVEARDATIASRDRTIAALRRMLMWGAIGCGAVVLAVLIFAGFCVWDIAAIL